jgi:hypothetical protein
MHSNRLGRLPRTRPHYHAHTVLDWEQEVGPELGHHPSQPASLRGPRVQSETLQARRAAQDPASIGGNPKPQAAPLHPAPTTVLNDGKQVRGHRAHPEEVQACGGEAAESAHLQAQACRVTPGMCELPGIGTPSTANRLNNFFCLGSDLSWRSQQA